MPGKTEQEKTEAFKVIQGYSRLFKGCASEAG
jgi:hypothetical protein